MICKKCGFENPSQEQFCRKCGSNMNNQAEYTPPVASGTSVNSFIRELKYLGKNRFFIFLLVSLTIGIAASVMFSLITKAEDGFGIIISDLIYGNIANILILYCAYSAYFKVNTTKNDGIDASSFNLLKILYRIFTCLLVVVLLAATLTAIFSKDIIEATPQEKMEEAYTFIEDVLTSTGVINNVEEIMNAIRDNPVLFLRITTISAAVVLGLFILFYFKVSASYKRIERACKTGIAKKNKASSLVIVFYIIAGIFSIIGSFTSDHKGMHYVLDLSTKLMGAASLLFVGLMLQAYNAVVEKYDKIQTLEQLAYDEVPVQQTQSIEPQYFERSTYIPEKTEELQIVSEQDEQTIESSEEETEE